MGRKHPSVAPARRRAWVGRTPCHALSGQACKINYIPDPGGSLNRVLRKTLESWGSFPSGKAAPKLILLAVQSFEKGCSAIRNRVAVRIWLARMFAERLDA